MTATGPLTGRELAREYYAQVVRPLIQSRWPELPHAAGRLGSGSDVLGLDDATSRDHDWGLRLSLFVAEDLVAEVDAELKLSLPEAFLGYPTRFAFTGEREPRHHVEVGTVSRFAMERLGFDPRGGMSAADWLSLTGQAVLEVTAGPLFADDAGELSALRSALEWYPDDVWRYVVACDWARIAEELPLMGRAADVGDDIGSRVIAARLVHIAMHLAFLLERRWPPYSKWFGTVFRNLPTAGDIGASLERALAATVLSEREAGIAAALEVLLRRQNSLGLGVSTGATVPFWDRPYLHPNPMIVAQLLEPIAATDVRALPPGLGSVEQRTDNVNVLVDPLLRRAMIDS